MANEMGDLNRASRNGESGDQGGSGSESGSNNKRRRRRRRGRRGGGEQGSSGNQGNSNKKQGNGGQNKGGNNGNGNNRRRNNHNNNNRRRSGGGGTPVNKFGGREPTADASDVDFDETLELNPFEVFCAWHLGITADNKYRKPRLNEVARRFDVSTNEMQDALERFGMDKKTLADCNYELSLAQLDIRVAPEGIDRRELAKNLFAELLEMNPTVAECHIEAMGMLD